MSRQTVQQKSATGRFIQSMGTGARILGGGDMPAYTLTHLSSSSRHREGSFETIILPYIEMGRDSSCAVRFADDVSTVSRKHASIERKDATTLVIRNLSDSNPTLVNGRPVKNEWFLSNGDIIQLSMEGPKMRFNISPTGTAKIGFTNKAKLVAQQAIRPYRNALLGLGALMLVVTGVLSYFLYDTSQLAANLGRDLVTTKAAIAEQKKQDSINTKKLRDSIGKVAAVANKKSRPIIKYISNNTGTTTYKSEGVIASGSTTTTTNTERIIAPNSLAGNLFIIHPVKVTLQSNSSSEGEQSMSLTEENISLSHWTYVGFLVSDGRFITAREAIQFWRYGSDDLSRRLNALENNGGYISIDYEAVSASGSKLLFNYNSRSSSFSLDDSGDENRKEEIDGNSVVFKKAKKGSSSNWASANKGASGLPTMSSLPSEVITSIGTANSKEVGVPVIKKQVYGRNSNINTESCHLTGLSAGYQLDCALDSDLTGSPVLMDGHVIGMVVAGKVTPISSVR